MAGLAFKTRSSNFAIPVSNFSLFANLAFRRIRRHLANDLVGSVKPDLFRARLWSRTAIDSLLDNLAHPIEPPASALHSLLAAND
jgi:hypothetical protein